MIYISPTEHRLLRHAVAPYADLSRPSLAEAAMVDHPTSISRILSRLRKRGLIKIERGRHRRIIKIATTFPFIRGKTFQIRRNPGRFYTEGPTVNH